MLIFDEFYNCIIFKQSILKPSDVINEYFYEKVFSDNCFDKVTMSNGMEINDEVLMVIIIEIRSI